MNHAVKKIATGVPLSDNEQDLMDLICAKDRRRAAYMRGVVCFKNYLGGNHANNQNQGGPELFDGKRGEEILFGDQKLERTTGLAGLRFFQNM
jgi:hypothetical protein